MTDGIKLNRIKNFTKVGRCKNIICALFEASYRLQFARKLTFVKLSIPLNCNKGNREEETRRVALRTLFHQVKEIGNNRYRRN